MRKHHVDHFEIKTGRRPEVVFYDLSRKGRAWKRERTPTEASLSRLAALANSDKFRIEVEPDFETIGVWRRNFRQS